MREYLEWDDMSERRINCDGEEDDVQIHRYKGAAFALLVAMNSWNLLNLSNSSTVCAIPAISP